MQNGHACSSSMKSDVYSVGVLLWVISSGRVPFNTDGEYDISLALKILQGLRESVVPNTPDDYVKLYIGKYFLFYFKKTFFLKKKIYNILFFFFFVIF